jgi:VanZ family protein
MEKRPEPARRLNQRTAPAPKPDPAPGPSAFARWGLLAYLLLIVYASWYPFSSWHDSGLSAFGYLFAAWPHYWTVFDLTTNVIGYIPLGILMVFALYPKLRGAGAIMLTIAGGTLLSAVMEAVQTYLPTRVASNLDLLTNASGIAIGSLAGVLLSPAFLEQSRLLVLRRSWFIGDAGPGLIVLALWPLAQIYPQGYLFGHGQFMPILSDWLGSLLATPIDLSSLIRRGADLTAKQYWLSETIITTCGLCGAVLTLLCLTRMRAPRATLVFLLIAAALTVKSLSNALQFSPENAFAWLTPGAQGGLLLGMVMLTGLVFAPAAAQRHVAALTLVMSLAALNTVPANPYFTATLQTWVQGKFLNFNGAAQFLSLIWPFFALWFLLRTRRGQKK